jgi:AraC-like DNA-binding protein
MIYLRHIPSSPLNRYIEHLYYLEGDMPFPDEQILPIPTLDLKINLCSPIRLYKADQTDYQSLTQSWLTGLYSIPHRINWPTDMRLYGVRFKPSGVYPFLRRPMSELYNQVVPLETVWGCFASELRERLQATPNIEAGFILFEHLLFTRLNEEPHHQTIVDYSLAQIARYHGALSVRKLSDHIGVSQNHLGTQFKRIVGTSTKEMARLYRFEYVLKSIASSHTIDWTQIAQESGYYDQSHLNKDFVAFTGHSPTDYLHLRRLVYREGALVEQLSLRILPTD